MKAQISFKAMSWKGRLTKRTCTYRIRRPTRTSRLLALPRARASDPGRRGNSDCCTFVVGVAFWHLSVSVWLVTAI
ncbi:uncharacterized protein PHACADRAFT_254876 [Phanerochaete carnosa HHB-10118-sp]|uniref:Uncharacterized protein n=1 Tax=Phanerochaete carnosa (strain HHB-10118-sp) TaxID=650164 RepID=K5WD71_PHACS|nr:uncharacterized protein PHACADRAFT_254876 [Phanerochaete carnosa HHB-10118-sp]EKM57225.1 hypothetical protein PHACADRAFT_254876 [Phanerochaete carnosa HHB-10118-sp]